MDMAKFTERQKQIMQYYKIKVYQKEKTSNL